MLTTITPYWNRPEMLQVWFKAVEGATFDGVKHIIIFVGEPIPDWVQKEYGLDPRFLLIQHVDHTPGDLSIGHYHNEGARLASTEWMMKMDIDTLPNVRYFRELVNLLRTAEPNEWFNGGMVYVCQNSTCRYLRVEQMPLSESTYNHIMGNLRAHCGGVCCGPAATNFICRRNAYLEMGGCDEKFRGYGWEDYQQIYMLEHRLRGTDPLRGVLRMDNVTKRCCAEISRLRARYLLQRNPWLCLLHRFHQASPDRRYKSPEVMQKNRQVLFDYIMKFRVA